MSKKNIVYLIISMILLALFFVGLILRKTLQSMLFEEFCSEECHPFNYDIYDDETCVCWLENGKLEIREIK